MRGIYCTPLLWITFQKSIPKLMKVSLCENLKKSEIIAEESIDNVLLMIKNGYTKYFIDQARFYGKGTKEYNSVKIQIPTYTPNATFYISRMLRFLQNPSGFIYLDFDDSKNIQSLKGFPYIYSCWKSVSGEGYGALAKINGINPKNFKDCWDYIARQLKTNHLKPDKQTCDITRQNVISYDPDIYLNMNCIPLEASVILNGFSSCNSTSETFNYSFPIYTSIPQWDKSISSTDYPQSFKGTDCTKTKDKLIYYTTLDDYHGEKFIVIEEGREFRSCYLPKIIEIGKRHKWMTGHTISLLFNNPSISYDRLAGVVNNANKTHCSPPLTYTEINSIVKWLWDKHILKKLNYNAMRKKIWLDPSFNLTRYEKRKIVGTQTGILRKKRTLKKLKVIYFNLKVMHDKVTQKMVADESHLSVRTIINYWDEIIS